MSRPNRRAEFVGMNVLSAVVVLTGLVFVTTLADTVQLPKAIVVVIAAVVLTVFVLVEPRRTLDFAVPRHTFLALGVFIAACAIAVIAGGSPIREIVGPYGRWTGAALYMSLAVLMLIIAGLGVKGPRLLAAFAATTALVALYANVQRMGLDPIPWVNPYGDKVASTLGNPNFAASYVGFGVPVWLWALMSTRRPVTRVGAGVVLLVHFSALIWTGSLQGPMVAAVSSGVFAFVVAPKFDGRGLLIRRLLVGGAGVGGALGLAGLSGVGPLATMDWSTIRIRFEYWRAGLEMVADSPIWGWGFTGYASLFRQYRSLEAFEIGSLTVGNDAAHNVLLDMAVSGGLILGLAYVGVLVAVTISLVRSVRMAEVGDLPMLGAIAGVWVGYLSQSMISIDVPPLAVIGWFIGGLVLAQAPGSDIVVLQRPSRTSGVRSTVTWSVAAIVFASLTAGSVALLRQASADRQYAVATRLISIDQDTALQAAERAAASAPWEPRYLREVGDVLYVSGRAAEALERYESAAGVDPHWLPAAVVSARLSAELGELDRAMDWYLRAIEIEPIAPELRLEAAKVAVSLGDAEAATHHLEAALSVDANQASWWRLLAEVLRARGDVAGAEAAERRADELS